MERCGDGGCLWRATAMDGPRFSLVNVARGKYIAQDGTQLTLSSGAADPLVFKLAFSPHHHGATAQLPMLGADVCFESLLAPRMYLDITAEATDPGTAVHLYKAHVGWNQRFLLLAPEMVGDVPESPLYLSKLPPVFRLFNRETGMCVAATGDGLPDIRMHALVPHESRFHWVAEPLASPLQWHLKNVALQRYFFADCVQFDDEQHTKKAVFSFRVRDPSIPTDVNEVFVEQGKTRLVDIHKYSKEEGAGLIFLKMDGNISNKTFVIEEVDAAEQAIANERRQRRAEPIVGVDM